jgi:hypothetical protein
MNNFFENRPRNINYNLVWFLVYGALTLFKYLTNKKEHFSNKIGGIKISYLSNDDITKT